MIASHNSLTYLRPVKWWMRLFNFMSKCQNKTIKEQYEDYKVRMFDLRVDFDKNNNLLVKHGLAVYNFSTKEMMGILNYLNNKKGVKYVNITLECSFAESIKLQDWKRRYFTSFCRFIEGNFTKIRFIGGDVKYSWNRLYHFKNRHNPVAISRFASIATKCKFDDLWPWLYAKRHNKESMKEDRNNRYLWLDFVEIQ